MESAQTLDPTQLKSPSDRVDRDSGRRRSLRVRGSVVLSESRRSERVLLSPKILVYRVTGCVFYVPENSVGPQVNHSVYDMNRLYDME